ARFELFGDEIEKIHLFDPETGRNQTPVHQVTLLPTTETLYSDDNRQTIALGLKKSSEGRGIDAEQLAQVQRDVVQRHQFPGLEFLLPWFYDQPSSPLAHFDQAVCLWTVDSEQINRAADTFFAELKKEFEDSEHLPIR